MQWHPPWSRPPWSLHLHLPLSFCRLLLRISCRTPPTTLLLFTHNPLWTLSCRPAAASRVMGNHCCALLFITFPNVHYGIVLLSFSWRHKYIMEQKPFSSVSKKKNPSDWHCRIDRTHCAGWLLDPNGFLTYPGYPGKVQLRELRWTWGALCTELRSLWVLLPQAIMEYLCLGHMKDKRLIQSALDLNLIDCRENSRCEAVSMMRTVVRSFIQSMSPPCLCCMLAKVHCSNSDCDVIAFHE